MSTHPWAPRRLHTLDEPQLDELAGVLMDCVEGGASVSFMHPLTRERALGFWRRVAQGVAAGERALLIAEDAQGLCGTCSSYSICPRTSRTAPISPRCWCIAARVGRVSERR